MKCPRVFGGCLFWQLPVATFHREMAVELWEAWLRDTATRGVFAPAAPNHDCLISKCQIRRIPLYYCGDSLCMGPSPPTLGWLNGTLVYMERSGQPECKHHSLSKPLRPVPAADKSVFFCLRTGTPHMCGTMCRVTAHTLDGITCMLTGLEIEAGRVTTARRG